VIERSDTLVVGEYFLAVEGLAMIRNALTAPSATRARVEEIRDIVANGDEFPYSLQIPMTQHDVEDGYTKWAPRYDGPNPAIELEQPIVHRMLEAVPVGVALDAACGTGRHAAKLAELGHKVIGVDTTEAMLAVARDKVPDADFRIGRLEALPLEDDSVDVITCTLALTHVEDLAPVTREFARVLRAGGEIVLADIHPLATLTGGIAGFPEDITRGIPYVVNLTHHVSEYISAFLAARLTILECLEPRVSETMLQVFPSYMFLPDATRQAFEDTPYLLIWRLTRQSTRA
jgi:ubiquinone/menaquinone biosynthesis C-methylase UbiE